MKMNMIMRVNCHSILWEASVVQVWDEVGNILENKIGFFKKKNFHTLLLLKFHLAS